MARTSSFTISSRISLPFAGTGTYVSRQLLVFVVNLHDDRRIRYEYHYKTPFPIWR